MSDFPAQLHAEIEKYERKHAENPGGRHFVPLANAYRKLGELGLAESLLREGLRRHPEYLSAHIVLGRTLADRGAHEDAAAEFRHVLAIDPQNLIALRTLGEIAAGEGRVEEAGYWYRELLSVDPMNDEARSALAGLEAEAEPEDPAPDESGFQAAEGWWEAAEAGAEGESVEPAPAEQGGHAAAGHAEAFVSDAVPDAEAEAELEVEPEPPGEAEAEMAFEAGAELVIEPELEEEADGIPAMEDEPLGWGADWAVEEIPAGAAGEREAEEDETVEGEGDASATAELDGWDSWPEDAAEVEEGGEEEAYADLQLPDLDGPLRNGPIGGDAPDLVSPAAEADFGELGGDAEELAFDEVQEDEHDELASRTLAELYAAQGFVDEAADMYRELIRRRGEEPELVRRLGELQGRDAPVDVSLPELQPDLREVTIAEDAFDDALIQQSVALDTGGHDAFADSFAFGFAGAPDEAPAAAAPTARGEEVPAVMAAGAGESVDVQAELPGAGTIVDFFGGLLSWRSGGGGSPAQVAEPAQEGTGAEMAVEEPAAAEPVPAAAHFPEMDSWLDTPFGTGNSAEPEAEPDAEPDAGGAAPEESDEPFPWELPTPTAGSGGEAAQSQSAARGADTPSHEPPPAPPEPAAAPTREPAPGSPAAGFAAPDDDDDLESFQAWLRSLKR